MHDLRVRIRGGKAEGSIGCWLVDITPNVWWGVITGAGANDDEAAGGCDASRMEDEDEAAGG